MSITDPIADMVTLLRNATKSGKLKVDVRASKINEEILKILKKESFIQDYKRMEESKQGSLRIYLKFDEEKKPGIMGIKRISKPGLKVYKRKENIKSVLGGIGIAIITTSQGILTDSQAREKNIGGEIMLEVW